MDDQQFKQAAVQHNIDLLRSDLQRLQDRAGTMVAVISTILGIGLPLIAQPGTRQYFHVMPFGLLIIAFVLFYLAFIRGTTSVILTKVAATGADGKSRNIAIHTPYKPNRIEKLLSFQLTLPLKQPADIPNRLEQLVLRRRTTSQWGHAFFLATIALEAEEVIFPSHASYTTSLHIFSALVVILFVKLVFLFTIRGEQTF